MSGLVKKIDQLPPGRNCASCLLTQHPDIIWYLDSGILTEVEGPNFICNRCFAEMARVSEEYITHDDHVIELNKLKNLTASKLLELEDLRSAARVLKREFDLELEDLHRYVQIKGNLADKKTELDKVTETCRGLRAEEIEIRKDSKSLQEIYSDLAAKVNEKNAEFTALIEATLADVLERRGRTDLISILLNDQFPSRDDLESERYDSETDAPSGEHSSFSTF
jgi:hypothetical protein